MIRLMLREMKLSRLRQWFRVIVKSGWIDSPVMEWMESGGYYRVDDAGRKIGES